MALKIYGIYEKGSDLPVMYIQVKRKDTAERCIKEYQKSGRLSAHKSYEVRAQGA